MSGQSVKEAEVTACTIGLSHATSRSVQGGGRDIGERVDE